LHINQAQLQDKEYAILATSCLMAVNGHSDIAGLILELEDDNITEKFDMFLEKYDEFVDFIRRRNH
jgi:hypothetical protein